MTDNDTSIGAGASAFPDTPWSRILRAGKAGGGLDAHVRPDWDRLAQGYWRPVYLCIRRKWRLTSEDAKDLTQAFFVHLMETGFLGKADPARGRFRALLRSSLENFLRDDYKAARRVVRGGEHTIVSIDAADAAETERLLADLAQAPEAEVFDREWRRGILAEAVARVRRQYETEGRPAYFAVLERKDLADLPAGGSPASYEDIARDLGLAVDAVRNYLHHARVRLRGAVTDCIREYVTSEAELQEEIGELFAS